MQNIEQVREIIIPTPTPEPTRTSTELAILAELSKGDGDFEDAIGYYEQAVTLDATRPEIYVLVIDLLVRQGQAELAVEKADQAVVLAPDSDRVLTASAAAYIANGEQLDDRGDSSGANLQYAHAFGDALKAKNNNPQNATALAYAALGLVFQGNPELYSQAEELADEALLLEPNNPFVRYTMGQVFTLQAFYLNALEQFQLGIQSTLNRDAQQEWPIGFEET
ncbi:MAG: tetratricopeptide repeat protein, partial [Methylococcales bacterium]|nr:tetratricopeptide repeat protein [Methylococcales bacterium]